MADKDYTEVKPVYVPEGSLSDLILKAKSPEGAYLYSTYLGEEDIPDYLKAHIRRSREAEKEVENSTKLSRLVEEHLNDDTEKEWRLS